MTTTIHASRILWPMHYPERSFSRYAVTVLYDDIPARFDDYVTPKAVGKRTLEFRPDMADKMLCRINQSFLPRITFDNGTDGLRQFAELQEIAKVANIGSTRLFHDIPATLAVEPVEMIDVVTLHRPQAVKRLQVIAIRCSFGDLIKNLDHLLTEHFR